MTKNKKRYKLQSFIEARIILYVVLVINFVVVYKISPFNSLCDEGTNHCLMCGMRNAVDKLIALDFSGAYNSNEYIVIVLLCFVFIIADCMYMCVKKVKKIIVCR